MMKIAITPFYRYYTKDYSGPSKKYKYLGVIQCIRNINIKTLPKSLITGKDVNRHYNVYNINKVSKDYTYMILDSLVGDHRDCKIIWGK